MSSKSTKSDETKKPKSRLFLYVTLAFIFLIAAWTFLIVTAVKNQPEIIEVEQTEEP